MANEKRLVWTKDVLSFLCKRCNEMYSDEPCEPSDCLMIEELEKCPTVDAVEVVHGEWSTIEDDYCGLTALQCSKCNQEYWFEDEPPIKIYNYCPNCGADMRERKDDGN